MPVLKPNEAMIEQAAAPGRRNRLLADLRTDNWFFDAGRFPHSVEIVQSWRQALSSAGSGRARATRSLVAEHPGVRDCDLIALAQYSMAPAAALVAEASVRPFSRRRIAPC